jgi:hypothetical protein
VLGVWQSGLIVLHDSKPRAVGKSQVHHNLYLTSAKLIEGEPLEVVSYKVDMRGKHLAWLLERIDKQRAYLPDGQDDCREEVEGGLRHQPVPSRRLRWEGVTPALRPGRGARLLSVHGRRPGGGVRAVLAEAGGFVGGDESGRVGVGQVGHALLWLPARKPAVRLRLELGSFSCHSSPIALTVEAVWRLGRARAKGGCRLRELNRIGWGHR